MNEKFKQQLIEMYWDFRNNYLTVAKWAEHNGLYEEDAEAIINAARHIINSPHPEE